MLDAVCDSMKKGMQCNSMRAFLNERMPPYSYPPNYVLTHTWKASFTVAVCMSIIIVLELLCFCLANGGPDAAPLSIFDDGKKTNPKEYVLNDFEMVLWYLVDAW